MSTRSRRANAGNRMSLLLAEQTPLNDEESALFAERDDDEDFDLEAEEERQRQMTAAATASSDGEDREEGEGSGDDDSGEESEHDDSNFSDSTDDSELENDVEPVDAGEKELQKEQRTLSREKRIAERNKMFTIKRRAPKPENSEPKKKRVFTSADLLLKGRHSSRKSALRNKQHLIEQMREVEERRARYVPPKKKKLPKLTQEQRLEETIKTEAKNLASLNKFVELEEERKLQQRLAMISKRPRLTQFVRFHSAQYLAPPKLVEVLSDKTEDEGDGLTIKSESSLNHPTMNQVPSASATSGQNITNNDHSQTKPNASDNNPMETHAEEATEQTVQDSKNVQRSESSLVTEDNTVKKQETNEKPGNDEKNDSVTSEGIMEVDSVPSNGVPAKQDPDQDPDQAVSGPSLTASDRKEEPVSEARPDAATVKVEPSTQVKYEEDVDEEQKLDLVTPNDVDPVQGPAQLKTYDFLTLHEFPDGSMNKYAVRSIVLGRIASMPAHMPAKRMCPFSGLPARYLDPTTGVAYYNLETNKMLRLASNNELGWSKELGGVFTSTLGKQRHAKGVPEGFA